MIALGQKASVAAGSCQSSPSTTTIPLGDNAVFTSPNYPSNYNVFTSCSWNFQSPAGSRLSLSCDPVYIACFTNIIVVDAGSTQRFNCFLCSMPVSFSYEFTSDVGSVGISSFLFADRGFSCQISAVATTSTQCKCGVTNTARIVGGTETQTNEYPWMALVTNTATGERCGGTVISDAYILSAAHCTLDKSASDFEIKLGLHTADSNPAGLQTRNVLEIIPHPNYNSNNNDYDAVLLRIDPITFTDIVKPLCLPAGSSTYAGTTATVAGWGVRNSGDTTTSNVLLDVSVPVLDLADCRTLLGTASVTDQMLCAGSAGKDACQGDSGGPLFTSGGAGYQELIGVVSWGNGCGVQDSPGVYTRATSITTWINTRIVASNTCPRP